MLRINGRRANARFPYKKIAQLEGEMNKQIYALFELTVEEMTVAEDS